MTPEQIYQKWQSKREALDAIKDANSLQSNYTCKLMIDAIDEFLEDLNPSEQLPEFIICIHCGRRNCRFNDGCINCKKDITK